MSRPNKQVADHPENTQAAREQRDKPAVVATFHAASTDAERFRTVAHYWNLMAADPQAFGFASRSDAAAWFNATAYNTRNGATG